MKIARTCSAVFGVAGAVLLFCSVLLCLLFLDVPVQLVGKPTEALACAEEMMDALAEGDFAAASERMYGQPDLGAGQEPDDAMSALVWETFADSLSYEFVGVCHGEDTGIYQSATITALDIPSMTEDIQTYAHALLTARVEAAEDMDQLYDANNNFRQDLIDQVLREALERAVREDGQYVTREISLRMIYRDGQWWVVPDQALLQTISGGVA